MRTEIIYIVEKDNTKSKLIVAISDTHGQHDKLILPKGDIIIHAGDISPRGRENEIKDFLSWFKSLDYKYKIFIAGNHDFYFENRSQIEIDSIIPEGVIYLNDSGITIEGLKIWGSPISPWFYNWAFNRHRGESIKKHWDLIPSDTNILITHGPAFDRLDKTDSGKHVGCKDLLEVIEKIKPIIHVCGHIHEGYGVKPENNTCFYNVSVLDENYHLINSPIQIKLA